MMEIIIYCDESTKDGEYFSNFFGGALILSRDMSEVEVALKTAKDENHLFGEVKWTKVSESYLDKYISIIDVLFDLIAENKIKIRIMFTQNAHQAVGLTHDQVNRRFQLLYYQFFKHAFGLRFCNPAVGRIYDEIFLKIFFDALPDEKEKNEEFKEFIQRLEMSTDFREANIKIRNRDIGEVVSHDHVILQFMDIVLGAMQFRLNNFHLEKIPGTNRRGKRTRAKEKLYKHILKRIREIYPYFNIGESTGTGDAFSNTWSHPYRHWKFVPAKEEFNGALTKKRKCPADPT